MSQHFATPVLSLSVLLLVLRLRRQRRRTGRKRPADQRRPATTAARAAIDPGPGVHADLHRVPRGRRRPLGFRLDAASSYAMLVGAASVEVPSLMRVAPGNPDASYIIQKLEGHAAVGGQMPLGGPYLPQATIDVIRQWITDGAQPTAAAGGVAVFTSAAGDRAAHRSIAGATATRTSRRSGRRTQRESARGGRHHADAQWRRWKLRRRKRITVGNRKYRVRSLTPTVIAIRARDHVGCRSL